MNATQAHHIIFMFMKVFDPNVKSITLIDIIIDLLDYFLYNSVAYILTFTDIVNTLVPPGSISPIILNRSNHYPI